MSGSYKINGVDFLIQPTTGRWLPRDSIGIDGNGKSVYVGVRSFEIKWQLVDPATFNQLENFYLSNSITGTAVAEIPEYGKSVYDFYAYSGCVINEPSIDTYFSAHHINASLLITNIVTP